MIRSLLFYTTLLFLLFFGSCSTSSKLHYTSADAPDYSLTKNWAALPNVKDSADLVPLPEWKDEQATSPADVFFIHPTTYTGKSSATQWNADLSDQALNNDTDKSTIRYQASIFNGAGKIYAPRYRQAHLKSFFDVKHKQEAARAQELAYQDVKSAFQYYLQHFNQGRPFILAAHSQGSMHAVRLIGELIDNTPLEKQLIVAYMPGWPVKKDQYVSIKECKKPDETDCFCTWRTYKTGYIPPRYHYPGQNVAVTNPVTWNCDQPACSKEMQLGGILRDFHKLFPNLANAEVHEDILWVDKPQFPGSVLFTTNNYHIADYNFFYADVRKNAQDRVKAYLSKP
jgi:hypothetical protein